MTFYKNQHSLFIPAKKSSKLDTFINKIEIRYEMHFMSRHKVCRYI